MDFRQLIKVLAEAFRVRIEMKQIGARQEAGRIGGIGPCGRELCCATWMTSFVSVSTSAARFQDISLNPQKLAGQCAKLKCCLNYEVDCYVEAQKRLPSREIELETKDGTFYFFKADILSNQVSYSTDKNFPANLVTISGKRAFEVIAMNKKGMKPDSLLEAEVKQEPKSRQTCWNRKVSPASTATGATRKETTLTGIRRKEKETMITARRHRLKVEIVRNNLREEKTKTVRNRQKTETEGKKETETIAREIIITGTEDRTKDEIMKTDVRKEDRIKSVHKIRTVRKIRNVPRIRNVRPTKSVRKIENASRNRNARRIKNDHRNKESSPIRNVLRDLKEIRIKRNRKIMRSLLRNNLFCLLGVCLMAACNENTVYHSYQSLPNEGWAKSDTLSFSVLLQTASLLHSDYSRKCATEVNILTTTFTCSSKRIFLTLPCGVPTR